MLSAPDADIVRRDPGIPGLSIVLDPEAVIAAARPCLPRDGAFDELRYLPERRYVARWLSGNRPVAVLKLHTEREYALAQRNVTAFRGHASFRRARCLGQSDRRRILLHEWLPGRVLSEAVSDPDPDFGALTSVGAALAHLHAQDATGLALLRPDVEAATLLG